MKALIGLVKISAELDIHGNMVRNGSIFEVPDEKEEYYVKNGYARTPTADEMKTAKYNPRNRASEPQPKEEQGAETKAGQGKYNRRDVHTGR